METRFLTTNDHMRKLLNLPKVASCDDLSGLQMLHERVQSHVRSLKHLDVHIDSYGVMLKAALLQSLPYELVLNFNKLTLTETSAREPRCERPDEVSTLLDLLNLEVRSREITSVMTGS